VGLLLRRRVGPRLETPGVRRLAAQRDRNPHQLVAPRDQQRHRATGRVLLEASIEPLGPDPEVVDGQDLVARIRKITDKPIKWVINSHFHGDHHFGNPPFKALGATFVAQKETARLMEKVQPKEIARRGNFFKSRGFDPSEVRLILPDVTFDNEMTIKLGGRAVRLAYLGPGQQAGDTFVFFPHARMVFTTGMFGPRSMPNMAFTPSVENWIKLLDRLAAMDVDKILPAHGDVSTSKDVKELAAMVADEYATVQDAIAKGTTLDEALRTVKLPQYKDWRNYNRLEGEIRALYELIGTGKRSYFD